jgi:fructose-1,6-bisphosphatase II
MTEIFDFGFTRRVVNHRSSVGEHARHQQIVGCGVTGVFESDARGAHAKSVSRCVNGVAIVVKRRSHGGQPVGVEVDWALSKIIAARQRHVHSTAPREDWSEYHDRRTHCFKEVSGGDGVDLIAIGHGDRKFVIAWSRDGATQCFEELSHHEDVGDVRHIGETMFARREQARRHFLQYGVFGTVGSHLAVQGTNWLDNKRTHLSSIAGRDLWAQSRAEIDVGSTATLDLVQLPSRPDRNIALELIRVTEAAAIAAARWAGRGDKIGADGAAVDAMRFVLDGIAMDGVVVIGEGEKDEAPMLYNGEQIGDGRPPLVDIAVDPIDGTAPTAMGRNGAISVIALSERGTMFNPGPCFYMNKIAVGPRGRGSVDINASATDNLIELSKRLKKPVQELGVVILDRPRHIELVAEVREAGARVISITDGDVAGAIATGWPNSGADVLFGIGGTPEGVIAAAALKGLGGEIQGVLHAQDEATRIAAEALGYDFTRVLTTDDLVASDNCFFSATAITDGDFLRGVRFHDFGATTQSLVVRSRSGTVRTIETFHRHNKLEEFTSAGF